MTELYNNTALIIEIYTSPEEKCSYLQLDIGAWLEGYAVIFLASAQTFHQEVMKMSCNICWQGYN